MDVISKRNIWSLCEQRYTVKNVIVGLGTALTPTFRCSTTSVSGFSTIFKLTRRLSVQYILVCPLAAFLVWVSVWGKVFHWRKTCANHNYLWLYLHSGFMHQQAVPLQDSIISVERMFDQLVHTMAYEESVTEQMKSDDPAEWIACMNNIRSRATELVNAQLIYA